MNHANIRSRINLLYRWILNMTHVLLILSAFFGSIHTQINSNEDLSVLLEKLINQSRYMNDNQNVTKTDNKNSKIIYVKAPIEEVGEEENLAEQSVPDINLNQFTSSYNQVYNDDNNSVVNKSTYLTVVTIDQNSEQNMQHHKYDTSNFEDSNVHYDEKGFSDDNNLLNSYSDIVLTKITKPLSNPTGLDNQLPDSESHNDRDDHNISPTIVEYIDDGDDDDISFRMFTPKELITEEINPGDFVNNHFNPYLKHYPCPNPIRCGTVVNPLSSNLRMFQRSSYPPATYPTSYQPLAVLNSNQALNRAMWHQKLKYLQYLSRLQNNDYPNIAHNSLFKYYK